MAGQDGAAAPRVALYDRVFKPKVTTLPNGKSVAKPRSRAPFAVAFIVVMTVVSVQVTGFDMTKLVTRIGQFFVILQQMFLEPSPSWDYMSQVWDPLFATIQMSLLGSFIGGVVAIPFAMLAASNVVRSRVVVGLVRLFLSVVRTVPTLVSALIATYVFGLGTLAGTTAIAIFTFAYVGKLLYENIETADMGPFEAMLAMGSTRIRAFMGAIVPQVMPIYLSNCMFCFEGNVRYAAILGYVGAGGLGLILNENLGWREYANVGMVLVALFVTVFIIENTSRAIRRHLS